MREDWQEVNFGDVVQFPPKISMKKNEVYPFIPMETLDSGKKYVSPKEEKTLTSGGAKFEEGDTLFARITPCLQNGKISQAKNLKGKPGFGSTEYFIFRGKEGITDTDFIYYLTLDNWFKDKAIGSMVGASGRQRADAEFVRNIKIQLPHISTQRKIASILSAYDDLIENNLKRIKLLEEKAQLTYEEWFVKMRFPGYETAKFDEVTGLPEGWEKVKLGEVTDFKYGRMPKPENLTNIGYPVYSGYRITGYTNDYLFKHPTLIVVARGVGGTGDIKITPEKCWLTNLSIAILVKNFIFQSYLYYHLKDSNLRSLDSGAAQSQITIANLENFIITKSDIKLQELFDKYVDKIFKQINNISTQNRLLKEARDILLPRLMSGLIDVEEVETVNLT